MTSVENRVQNAVLTAMENLVILRVELAIKSANAPSGRSVHGNVLEPHQRDFLGNVERLQMTASSRINSNRDLNRIDRTRGNFTAQEGDLLVNGKKMTGKHMLITIDQSDRKNLYIVETKISRETSHE